jgi:hypothetical protein
MLLLQRSKRELLTDDVPEGSQISRYSSAIEREPRFFRVQQILNRAIAFVPGRTG